MFVDTVIIESPSQSNAKPSPESLLARLKESEGPKLRVYLGAAAGVGKTYQMLEDAHALKKQGIDVVIGCIETHGRAETLAQICDLEIVPMQSIEYRGAKFSEMNLAAILERKPEVVLVDELAHTNVVGAKNQKRYEDVLELLNNGISVITAFNVQHLESLNDVVARTIGVRVRETVPDWFVKRADEVINIDVSVDTLRTRLRQGKIYGVEKIEQALNNFFRKSNLSVLRELALREVADCQSVQDTNYRAQSGLEKAAMPEKVMVCLASRGSGKKLLRIGARIAGRLATDWHAVYVETPVEAGTRIAPETKRILQENVKFAEELGAKIICLQGKNIADELIKFAKENTITHVVFGQTARSRWEIFWHGSILNRFLTEVNEAIVHVVPIAKTEL